MRAVATPVAHECAHKRGEQASASDGTGRARQSIGAGSDEHAGEPPLEVEVDGCERPARLAAEQAYELRAGQPARRRRADQPQLVTVSMHAARDGRARVVENADDADDGRRRDRTAARRVVEADVPASDGHIERRARVTEPTDDLDELPHHVRPGRVAHVEAVSCRERTRAGAGDVAVGGGDDAARALARVELAPAAVADGGERDGAVGAREPDDARACRTRLQDGAAEHQVVILLVHPALRSQHRCAGDAQQQRGEIASGEPLRLGVQVDVVRVDRRQRVHALRPGARPVEHRTLVGEAACGWRGDDLTATGQRERVALDDLADDGRRDLPACGQRHHLVELLGPDEREHALLRLGAQDLPRRHRLVAQVDTVEVDAHAHRRGRRQLGRRARDAGSAHVLDARHEAPVVELEAALDEQLLGERVTDLHVGSPVLAVILERGARQHRRAADAVASRRGAEQHGEVTRTLRAGELQVLVAQYTDGERVDQRVVGVVRIEDGLAADVGDADAVAVQADAAHDAVDEVPLPLVDRNGRAVECGPAARVTEAQCVHDRDRARAHRQDVAQDPADPGRRALDGLDGARMVVRLDLEGDGEPVTDIDDPGVLARSDEHLRAGRGQPAQVHARGLVGAVLGPHHGVHAELGHAGHASERLDDATEFLVGQPELAGQRSRPDLIELLITREGAAREGRGRCVHRVQRDVLHLSTSDRRARGQPRWDGSGRWHRPLPQQRNSDLVA